jgi:perosamine synthetase
LNDTGQLLTSFEPGAPAGAHGIPLCVPELRGREGDYLQECLETNMVSSVGPFVERFERQLAERTQRAYGVATCSGTAALHVALQIAGVRLDDEVLVSALSFIAPANAIRYVGARPVFMDAEPRFWQMDSGKTIEFLDKECIWRRGGLYNKSSGRRVGAILPVHILGHPVDLDPIIAAAQKYSIPLIEDAAEGLGSLYNGRPLGGLGDAGCLSFNGNKIITTGGGGMLVTENAAWAKEAKYLTTQAKDDPLEYIHNNVGYNYRLTNIQAALGCAQMEGLDQYVEAKRANAQAYKVCLTEVEGITTMPEAPWAFSAFWLYTVLVDENQYGESSRSLLKRLGAHGVQARPLWEPLHRSQAHAGSQNYRVEIADQIHARALSLPSSVGLTEAQRQRVVDLIRR